MTLIPPPRRPVPRAIFDALTAEMGKRASRSVEAWIRAERHVVLHIVNDIRAAAGKDLVTENDVLKIERLAQGHIDYAWKYAYGAEELANK